MAVMAAAVATAVESGGYRLLSLSESEKLILVSRFSDQGKFLLDASSAKITVDGKDAEFKDLSRYSIVRVQMKLGKTKKNDVTLDGVALEIDVKTPEVTVASAPDESR
ncbi:MAG: hypothetical protein LBT74_00720 [Acidobacteriota bacterium]|nr:hypothetical protein [Acidobacteriota bacterium]